MARATAKEKLTRALQGAAWSQDRLQQAGLDAITRELHMDNLEHHLRDAKRLQARIRKETTDG